MKKVCFRILLTTVLLTTAAGLSAQTVSINAVKHDFALSFIVPQQELIKERSETLAANLLFEGNSTQINASLGDNATKLVEIERVIETMRKNRSITIREIKVVGYSSVDGYIDDNRVMAQKRASVIGDYFARYYGYAVNYYERGEDWQGLRSLVANSSLADRERVVSIIDNTEDVNLRKIKLRQLSSGRTYRTMQATIFPLLRRTDFFISYTVAPFDLEESRIALRSEPALMSLNELYTLALSYTVGSADFLEVFDIASRLYPTDIISKINNAALDIADGAIDRAINILNHISDPAALNNLGVAYTRKGDMYRAAFYFKQASEQGNVQATENLKFAR